MPNWCENELIINDGNSEKVGEMIELIKGEHSIFDFDNIIPYPDKYKKQDELYRKWEEDKKNNPNLKPPEEIMFRRKYVKEPSPYDGFNSGGIEWCYENWDTKWNACESVIEEDSEYEYEGVKYRDIKIAFNTAWSPPTPVVKLLASKFPELTITHQYFEKGMKFHGRDCYEKGKCISSEKTKYFGNRGG